MTDIFKDTPTGEKPDFTNIKVDDLVGEGQKYANADELAKAYSNADWAIAQKDAELAEERAKAKVLEDLLKAQGKVPDPDKNRKDDNQPDGNNREPRNEPPVAPPNPEAKDVDLKELVRQELSKSKEEDRFSTNVNTVSEQLANHFGGPDKAREYVNKKAKELGVGVDFLMDMAGRSPVAFLNTIELNTKGGNRSTPVPTPEINRSGAPSGNVKNFKYYEEIRKQNPKMYYSAAVQREMFSSRSQLGENFFN